MTTKSPEKLPGFYAQNYLLFAESSFDTVKGLFENIHAAGAGDAHIPLTASAKGIPRQSQHVSLLEDHIRRLRFCFSYDCFSLCYCLFCCLCTLLHSYNRSLCRLFPGTAAGA